MSIIYQLKEKKEKIKQMELEIEQMSIYNPHDIGEVISKLMTYLDNEPYTFIDDSNNGFKYYIHSKHVNYPINHNLAYLKNLEFVIRNYGHDVCFLPHSNYCDMINKPKESSSIQNFIDYLFYARIEEGKKDITKKELNDLLKVYITIKEYRKIYQLN